jgi:hypothetical protein
MTPSTEQLVREIAAQLGTTVEHLWEVLIYQASVTAAWNIALVVVLVAFFWSRYRFIRKQSTRPAGWDEVECGIALLFWFVLVLFAAMFSGFLLTEAVACLANPEFWALKQVLGR